MYHVLHIVTRCVSTIGIIIQNFTCNCVFPVWYLHNEHMLQFDFKHMVYSHFVLHYINFNVMYTDSTKAQHTDSQFPFTLTDWTECDTGQCNNTCKGCKVYNLLCEESWALGTLVSKVLQLQQKCHYTLLVTVIMNEALLLGVLCCHCSYPIILYPSANRKLLRHLEIE